jgi:hypothetical protein
MLNQVQDLLRNRLPIFLNKQNFITNDFKVINITKNVVSDGIEFLIETDQDLTIANKQNNYRDVRVGDLIVLSEVKYKFKIKKITKALGSGFYKNLTTFDTFDKLKFFYASKIEISDVISEPLYNGIHDVASLGSDFGPIIYPEDKMFRLNIDYKLNFPTDKYIIENEGYYNMSLWNTAEAYGSLNGSHEVLEIINQNTVKIKITKDLSINKFYFDNSYDELELTNAYIKTSPRVQAFTTEFRLREFIEKPTGFYDSWVSVLIEDAGNTNFSGTPLSDPTVISGQKLNIIRNYNLRIALHTNEQSNEVSDINLYDDLLNTEVALYASLFNTLLTDSQFSDRDITYYLMPTESTNALSRDSNLTSKEWNFRTISVLKQQFDEKQYLQVPLLGFDIKYFNENTFDSISSDSLWSI